MRFEDDVDDVVPLAVVLPRIASEDTPRIRKCKKDQNSNWASIILPNKREEQQKDPELKVIYSWIQEEKVPSTEELASLSPTVKALWTNRSLLTVSDDILWSTWKEGEDKKLFVVPEHLKKSVLKLAHDNIVSGHLGIAKTKERIKSHFFWPSLAADVENYVKACAICNRSKHLRRKYRAPMRSFTAGAPMGKCHLDILGPLRKTASGNSYVLLMVDQFTKWVEAAPIPDQSAETVARTAIDYLFSRFGCPREIVTDQGANFNSQLCEMLEIAKKRTTPYHPNANGQIERLNRTLLQRIRCTIRNGQRTGINNYNCL